MTYRTNLIGTVFLVTLITLNLFFTTGKTIKGYHGKEIVIKLSNAYFTALTESGKHQIKAIVNYTVSNSSLAAQKINAIMKVYSVNTTLIKTTSFPNGVVINRTGNLQLLTNMADLTQNVISVITLTNIDKSLLLSNSLNVPLHLGQSIQQGNTTS
ncbi:MAG: hypothetical protein ABJB85_06875 [Nitrososphaerota archaeon]